MPQYLSDETTALLANVDGKTRAHAVFIRVGGDQPLHLALTNNDIPLGWESVAPDGTVWRGAGRILDIPDLDVIINGLAEEGEFGVSGIDQATYDAFNELAGPELPSVKGAPINIGMAPLDERWQPRCPIIPLWEGTADYVTETMEAGEGDPTADKIYRLTISWHAGNSQRARAPLVSFTHAQQQQRSPGDTFFARAMRYVGSYFRIWPRY